MNKDIRKVLEENNYVILSDQYISLFNPVEDEKIENVKYLANYNLFQVKRENEFFEYKVKPKEKVKKRN